MTEHILKVAEPYFAALLDGSKTFEVRRNDRGFQKGDTLILIDITRCSCTDLKCERRSAPIKRKVTFVYAGGPRFGGHGGLAAGHVVLGLSAA